MTFTALPMDDLDRLAFRVARTVRTTYPHLLERGFTLSDLEERLAPYPEARREMAESGPDGYELTVLRLLAGERGYLVAEPELQEACRRALQMVSPTVSIVRAWAGSTLSLRSSAFTVGDERAVSNSDAASPAVSAPAARDTRCGCHYCGGTLPTGRSLTFCPYCGLDLTVRHCPACSTELERAWRFCVTCGRQADDADAPLPADGGGLTLVPAASGPAPVLTAESSVDSRRSA